MKRYTIYAPLVDTFTAYTMAFVLFDNFTVERASGVVGGNLKRVAHLTILENEANEAGIIQLRDKLAEASGETATVLKEDITIL